MKKYRRDNASKYLLEVHCITRTPKTLAKLAVIGGGPAFVYDGRFPLYPENELDKWAASQISPVFTSTTERSAYEKL